MKNKNFKKCFDISCSACHGSLKTDADSWDRNFFSLGPKEGGPGQNVEVLRQIVEAPEKKVEGLRRKVEAPGQNLGAYGQKLTPAGKRLKPWRKKLKPPGKS